METIGLLSALLLENVLRYIEIWQMSESYSWLDYSTFI
jgi:hypothetical protein